MDLTSFKNLLKVMIVSLIFISIAEANSKKAFICDQEYALCSSARCLPNPDNPNYSICECDVLKGKSIGYKTCSQRQASIDQYNAKHIISTFSFEQFKMKKSLSCPKGAPWSNCVDMPCTVDPMNVNRAVCVCTLNNTQAFFTFGGNCDANSCKTGFWSGATEATAPGLREPLKKEIKSKGFSFPKKCAAE